MTQGGMDIGRYLSWRRTEPALRVSQTFLEANINSGMCLLQWIMLLHLMGFLTGLQDPNLDNPRLELTSHL